jgi:hypothetical protein
MNCPDCKKPMEWCDTMADGIPVSPYWKCPICKIEIDDEEV